MRISISNIAWDVENDISVSRLLGNHNIDAIDIAPGKYFKDFAKVENDDILAVRNWWANRGIEVIGMQSLLFGTKGMNIFASSKIQKLMLDYLKEVCRIGNILNARKLVFGSPRCRDCKGLTEEKAFNIAVRFFKKLANIAAEFNVIICLEPNPECYGANFMTNSEQTALVVNAVEHPSLKMQFDSGSIFINNENPLEICSKYSHLIGHVHISNPNLSPLGSTQINHDKSAQAINNYLHEMPVTIEMLTKNSENLNCTLESAIEYTKLHYGNKIS